MRFDFAAYERNLADVVEDYERARVKASIQLAVAIAKDKLSDTSGIGDTVYHFVDSLSYAAQWSSNSTMAKGMRRLGVAQVGSDQLDQDEFVRRITVAITEKMLPKFFLSVHRETAEWLEENSAFFWERALEATKSLHIAGAPGKEVRDARSETREVCEIPLSVLRAEYCVDAVNAMAWAMRLNDRVFDDGRTIVGHLGTGVVTARVCDASADEYLTMAAELAVEVLTEMKSPGVALLAKLDAKECENCGDESESEICSTCQQEQAEEDRLNEEAKSAHEFRMTDDPRYRDDFNRRMRQRREMEWGDE